MTQITEDLFNKAGEFAAVQHNDEWFAINVSTTGESSEPGTVIVEYSGLKFEVWLSKYWNKANGIV